MPMITTSANALRQPRCLAEPRRDGDTDDGGHCQAGHDLRDGLGTIAGAQQAGGYERGDAEERAVRHPGDEPRHHQ